MRAFFAVVLCLVFAGCTLPTKGQSEPTEQRVPFSVSFHGASFGTAIASGYVGRYGNGICHEAVEQSKGPTSSRDIGRRMVIQYDRSLCKIALSIYEQPPE